MICDAFHFYCQKVLPAVYDESLSYYEVVCKLVKAMELLDQSQQDLEKRMDALDEISTVLWPQFQAEVNATLQQYAKAYEDFQAGITADISGFEEQLTAMEIKLTDAIASQNEAIAANNAAQLELLTQHLAAQDTEITNISNTVEQNKQDMADLTADVHDFIAQYSPPATVNGLSPQFLITANAGASIKAVQGLIELTATADGAGKAVINVSNYGDWVVTSEYQGQTKSITVSVDDVKQYAVNVEQAEKTYTVVITNDANFPEIVHSLYVVEEYPATPTSFTKTINIGVTNNTVELPYPGNYRVNTNIANGFPDAGAADGFTPAAATGALLYTQTSSQTFSITDDAPNASIDVHIPTITLTIDPSKTLTISSPITATDTPKTVTGSTPYTFAFWRYNMGWKFENSGVEKGWWPTSFQSIIGSLRPLSLPEWVGALSFVRPAVNATTTTTTIDNSVKQERLNTLMAASNIVINAGLDANLNYIGKLVRNTVVTRPYVKYEDGSYVLDTHIMGSIIPAFDTSLSDNTINITPAGSSRHPAFVDPNGNSRNAMFIPFGLLDENNKLRRGDTPNTTFIRTFIPHNTPHDSALEYESEFYVTLYHVMAFHTLSTYLIRETEKGRIRPASPYSLEPAVSPDGSVVFSMIIMDCVPVYSSDSSHYVVYSDDHDTSLSVYSGTNIQASSNNPKDYLYTAPGGTGTVRYGVRNNTNGKALHIQNFGTDSDLAWNSCIWYPTPSGSSIQYYNGCVIYL